MGQRTIGMEKRSEMTALRLAPGEKVAIKERAEKAGMSFTEYVVQCALGRRTDEHAMAGRIAELEQRMDAVERVMLGA